MFQNKIMNDIRMKNSGDTVKSRAEGEDAENSQAKGPDLDETLESIAPTKQS